MEFNNSTPGKRREGSAGGMDLSISGSMLAYRSNNCSQFEAIALRRQSPTRQHTKISSKKNFIVKMLKTVILSTFIAASIAQQRNSEFQFKSPKKKHRKILGSRFYFSRTSATTPHTPHSLPLPPISTNFNDIPSSLLSHLQLLRLRKQTQSSELLSTPLLPADLFRPSAALAHLLCLPLSTRPLVHWVTTF